MSVLIILSCLYGVGRSSLIVSRNLAISESVRIDQVPSAVGLGMLVMCFLIPPSYWFLGWIRDYTGSYLICLTAQNAFIVLFLLMWVPDMLYTWCKERNSKALVDEVAMSWDFPLVKRWRDFGECFDNNRSFPSRDRYLLISRWSTVIL